MKLLRNYSELVKTYSRWLMRHKIKLKQKKVTICCIKKGFDRQCTLLVIVPVIIMDVIHLNSIINHCMWKKRFSAETACQPLFLRVFYNLFTLPRTLLGFFFLSVIRKIGHGFAKTSRISSLLLFFIIKYYDNNITYSHNVVFSYDYLLLYILNSYQKSSTRMYVWIWGVHWGGGKTGHLSRPGKIIWTYNLLNISTILTT